MQRSLGAENHSLNHSLNQAIEWQAAFYGQIRSIPLMPESYPLAPEDSEFSDEIRPQDGWTRTRRLSSCFRHHSDKLLVFTVNRGVPGPMSSRRTADVVYRVIGRDFVQSFSGVRLPSYFRAGSRTTMIPESAAMKQETASTQKQVADTWATSHL